MTWQKQLRMTRRAWALALGFFVVSGCGKMPTDPTHRSAGRLIQEPPPASTDLVQARYDPNPHFPPVAALAFAQGEALDTLTVIWRASPAPFVDGRHLVLWVTGAPRWPMTPQLGAVVSESGVVITRYEQDKATETVAGSVVTVDNRTTFTFPAGELDFALSRLAVDAYYYGAHDVVEGYWYRQFGPDA